MKIPMLNLTHLKLGHNKLPALRCSSCQVGQAKNYAKVKTLELNDNEIATGANFFFSQFPSLKKLYLSNNNFQTIGVGILHGAFELEELYLDGNRLQYLTNRMFYDRRKLKLLNLSGNMIQGIDTNSFLHARNIQTLNLAGNRLSFLGARRLAPLRKLTALYLERNQISKISRLAFEELHSLQILNLSWNQVSLGQSDLDTAFLPMNQLKSLDLSGNEIMLIPRNAFRGLHNLLSLNLSSNDVIIVQSGAFSDLTSIKSIQIYAPKLICDCSARWLRNWVKAHSFEKSVIGKCKTPLWLAGKSLFVVDDAEFVCASKVNNSIKPEIIVHPKTQEIQRNSNVTLRCVATVLFPETQVFGLTEEDRRSRTSMNIEWYFAGNGRKERLIRDKVVKTSAQEHIGRRVYRRMSELTLNGIDYTDVGRYRCHVRNFYGDEWSQVANITVVVFPYFVTKPVDVRVMSGKSVKISCSAKGSPVPVIKVSRKKGIRFPAVDEKRFWFQSRENGYEFGISNVKIRDSGQYICSATSRVGTIRSSMVLTVIAQPRFLREMKSKKVVAGSTAVFECIFTGNPKPKVEWFKNSTIIAKGKNGRYNVNDQLLIILGVTFEDAGTYSCRVSNALGMKRQVAKLAVVSDVSDIATTPTSPQAMPLKLFIGIIVIVVISVTILTSVVWVALICLCKGRRNRGPPKNPSNVEATDHHDSGGGNPSSSDAFTVPPLLATDGSGLVFGYGHLYPDNQRHITEREILAHIRGENTTTEDIPLIAAGNPVLSSDAEALPAVSCEDGNQHREDDRLLRPQNALQRLDSQSIYDRTKGGDPSFNSADNVVESRPSPSPRNDAIYCSCPADIADTSTLKSVTETPQKRSTVPSRTSHKKRVLRRPSHSLLRRELDSDSYYDNYNNASSSGVESGESSSSSDSVSVTNFEVSRTKSSSVLGAV